jgi:Na+-transporting NADH:ubiquinone oxidoreductase subunit NqrD
MQIAVKVKATCNKVFSFLFVPYLDNNIKMIITLVVISYYVNQSYYAKSVQT